MTLIITMLIGTMLVGTMPIGTMLIGTMLIAKRYAASRLPGSCQLVQPRTSRRVMCVSFVCMAPWGGDMGEGPARQRAAACVSASQRGALRHAFGERAMRRCEQSVI